MKCSQVVQEGLRTPEAVADFLLLVATVTNRRLQNRPSALALQLSPEGPSGESGEFQSFANINIGSVYESKTQFISKKIAISHMEKQPGKAFPDSPLFSPIISSPSPQYLLTSDGCTLVPIQVQGLCKSVSFVTLHNALNSTQNAPQFCQQTKATTVCMST